MLEAIYCFQPLLSDKPVNLKRLFSRRAIRQKWNPRQFFYRYTGDHNPKVILGFQDKALELLVSTDFTFNNSSWVVNSDSGKASWGLSSEFNLTGHDGDVNGLVNKELLGTITSMKLFDTYFALNYSEVEQGMQEADSQRSGAINAMYGPPATSSVRPYFGAEKRLVFQYAEGQIMADDVGDGHRFGNMLVTLAGMLTNTVLLVEEIETHQHPAVLEAICNQLVDISKENNLQLIISTHSPDVYRILSKTKTVQFYHVRKDVNDVVTASLVESNELDVLNDIGFDPSFAIKFEKFVLVEGLDDAEILRYTFQETFRKMA